MHMTIRPYSLRRNGTHRQREITRKRFFISHTPRACSTRFGSNPMRKTPLILSPTSEFSTCFASCTSASTMSRNIGSSQASSSDSARFSMTDGALHTPCGRCYLLITTRSTQPVIVKKLPRPLRSARSSCSTQSVFQKRIRRHKNCWYHTRTEICLVLITSSLNPHLTNWYKWS